MKKVGSHDSRTSASLIVMVASSSQSGMVPFLDPVDREIALRPNCTRQGVFAGLDAIHIDAVCKKLARLRAGRQRIDAQRSSQVCREDWVEFLNLASLSESVLFASEGLSVI